MTNLQLNDKQKETLTKRLEAWAYWKLILGFILSGGIAGIDIFLILPPLDFIPVVDEAFLSLLAFLFGRALLNKFLNGTPTKKRE